MAWPHDGPSWSPDGGEYWCKGRTIYWNTGHVQECPPGSFVAIRSMDSGYRSGENYSEWTEEKRKEVREHYDSLWASESARIASQQAERESRERNLIASAKSKLTAEEFEALREYFWDN